MDSNYLFLDFETASEVDLLKHGSARYASHPSTKILCMGFAVNKKLVEVKRHSYELLLESWLSTPSNKIVAHNAMFEYEIITRTLGIEVLPNRFIDTYAIANHLTLPAKLEGVGKLIGEEKIEDGKRLINKLCKLPNPHTPENDPEDFEKLYAYCAQDVEVSRKFFYKFSHLFNDIEQRIWVDTCRINLEGIPVNMDLVQTMDDQIDSLKAANDEKLMKLAGLKTTQNVAIAKFCNLRSVDKVSIREQEEAWEAGESELLPIQYQALQLRKENSLSSLAKVKKVIDLQHDGRVHHGFKYAGASRTGRWSGRGLQPQNLPRGISGDELDKTLLDIEAGKGKLTDISNCIRAIIQADPGMALYVGDYSQIECRILAFLAGQKDLLHAFASGLDPYKMMAAKIYKCKIDHIDSKQRFMGKQLVLSCGYQVGGYTFSSLLYNNYNVKISEAEATKKVYAYRDSSQSIVKFWYEVENAFRRAFYGYPSRLDNGIEFEKLGGDCVSIKLISGRKLYYWGVRNDSGSLSYMQPDKAEKGFYRSNIYGGALVGHICQATSRDITAVGTIRLIDDGWHPVGYVHDEIICHDHDVKTIEEFGNTMLKPVKWAKGIPITGECFKTTKYQKG